MARYTLIQVVQDVQNTLEVERDDTIGETTLGDDIVLHIRNVYEDFVSYGQFRRFEYAGRLVSDSNPSRPTKLNLPTNTVGVSDLKYRRLDASGKKVWGDVKYLTPNEFLHFVQSRDNTATNIQTTLTEDNVELFIRRDQAPQYWTSFDERYIYCDAFDSTQDSTLQEIKTLCTLEKAAVFVASDTFDFQPLPTHAFPAFLARCRAKCADVYGNGASEFDVQEATRGLALLRTTQEIVHENTKTLKKYGRRR